MGAARILSIGGAVKLDDLLVDEQPVSPSTPRREGRDFISQQQLQLLEPTPATSYGVQPLVAHLTATLLRELRMFERTGQLPGGVSWDEQPAWRVELWEAFWEAQQAAADWPPVDYPLSGEHYE